MPQTPGDNHEPILELRGVHKRFEALEVLRGIDLRIFRRQTTVVIGESGTGKSVLLRHLMALTRPDRGSVHFDGQRIDTLSERQLVAVRKRFGLLFQMGALFDSLTVAGNVGFPLREHTDLPARRIDEIVAQKLSMVGLNGLQAKMPAQLSGGQRKRVALARAIALEPEVILYDEPTTGLDPVRADVINELILKLEDEMHVAGVVVTHDMTSAYKVADRIVMLHEGRIIADGSPDQIRATGDSRVRAFIEGRAGDDDLAALRQPVGTQAARETACDPQPTD
jgi:phospholipid/cholesterol/gamma-HCH transport system ATP-binding protein